MIGGRRRGLIAPSAVAVDKVDDGRLQAFATACRAIEGRRLFCLQSAAELERQYSSA
jgi:hypothetical protein